MMPPPEGRALHALRILLVEDSDDVRDAFGGLLHAEGADVVAAANGADAIAAAHDTAFDILLTDYGLPDIAGDALIREILATSSIRPKVVVVTGYGEPYVQRARQAGADVVLMKPVDWTRLLSHLRPYTRPVAA